MKPQPSRRASSAPFSSIDAPATQRGGRARRKDSSQAHGWARKNDDTRGRSAGPMRAALGDGPHRRATGTPLLLCTVLTILTAVGLARVHSRVRVLDLAQEITTLTEERDRLLDHQRRLETERAYLRTPSRIREQATSRLGMQPTPPERIQVIRVKPTPNTGSASPSHATRAP